ncbi:hypothetical protein EZS27_039116, partial [termite gut metagenome]
MEVVPVTYLYRVIRQEATLHSWWGWINHTWKNAM